MSPCLLVSIPRLEWSVKTDWTCYSRAKPYLGNQCIRRASDSVPRSRTFPSSYCISISTLTSSALATPEHVPSHPPLLQDIHVAYWMPLYFQISFIVLFLSIPFFCKTLLCAHPAVRTPCCVHTLPIVCKQSFYIPAQAGRGLVLAWQRTDSS